jgi:hypothetical protein
MQLLLHNDCRGRSSFDQLGSSLSLLSSSTMQMGKLMEGLTVMIRYHPSLLTRSHSSKRNSHAKITWRKINTLNKFNLGRLFYKLTNRLLDLVRMSALVPG